MAITPDSPSFTNLPTPQSYEQILSDALSSYATKIGIDDFNVGSAVTSFFEVVALTTARASGDLFQILRDFSVDRATGDALQRLATENNITPITASPATGFVSVIDVSFQKISTSVYAGLPAPNVGSTSVAVGDASKFPASGAVYLGRGTPNIEGPIAYSTPPVQVGTYWLITLSAPTAKFHNLGESVILAQGGNRSVPINSTVIAPAIGANPDIQYSTTQSAIVLDGETTANNVPITAQLPGKDGNVPIGAVTKFASAPFSGATVNNPLAFTTGNDNETDDELRVRIKNALSSIGLGTAFAVESAVQGASTTTPVAATVTSTDLLEASYGAVLFLDTGNGYEETSTGVGLESIVDSALGGEQFFQLACGGNQSSVAKAYLQTTLGAPFDLKGGDTLAVVVGGITYQHTFQTSDFRSPGAVTAFEVTASINGDTTLGFEALTAGGGTYVVIRDKTEGNDSIEVTVPITTGRDASIQMAFPAGLIETLRLYKNKIPLNKDGNTATVSTQQQSLWSSTIANGDTLILSVDGTAPITYTITNAMFIATGLFTSVSSTNSLASWVEVFNNVLTGVTAEIVGTQIQITSNLGANNRAKVVVDPGSTLVSKGMFSSSVGLSSTGAASDYKLSRNTAQFELTNPLLAGDQLTAGSIQTAARIQSGKIGSGSIILGTEGYVWLLIDDPGVIIPTGVVSNTTLNVSVASNVVTYTSNVLSAFTNVQVGDYVIVWSTDLPASDRFEGRVYAITGTTLSIAVTATEASAVTPVTGVNFTNGFVVIRCSDAPQKFSIPIGTSTIDQIASTLQSQTSEVVFSTLFEQYLVVITNTLDTSGSLMVVTADANGQQLNFTTGVLETSNPSLIAAYDSGQYDAQMPLFLHSTAAAPGVVAQPPDSFLTQFTSSTTLSGRDPNELVSFLHPYGAIRDAQPYGDFVQETSLSLNPIINISKKTTVRRVRGDTYLDRYFLAAPLSFGHNDSAVVIVDNNPVSGSFTIPFFRAAATNTSVASNTNTFNATDTAAGGAAFSTTFGSAFDFSNFKVLMQAKNVLHPSPSNTAILYRSALWGRTGERIQLAYIYPSSPNSPVSSVITNDEFVHINIVLASGAAISTGITASTQWNVSITANNPSAGIDQVTYTWSGTGTAPTLSLSGGEYVNISTNSGFASANTGVFKVSTAAGFTPTATSFSVQMPTGTASATTPVNTLVNGGVIFYSTSPTTANQVVTYVNANLNTYLSASLANYLVSNNGTGVILLGTYEDSGFTNRFVQLKDGLNWLASSNLSGSPKFSLKNALTLPTAFGYAFNNSESIIFSPTTMEQVSRFVSVLAVTGFTTLGEVTLVDRGTRVQLSTQTLGSAGAIQIVGGLANGYQVPIFGSAARTDNIIMTASANLVSADGVQSGQWFRLAATNTQSKAAGISSNTSATIIDNNPTVGQSTIQLLNRNLNQRYYGKPRYHVRTQGRTFRIEKQGKLVCLSANPNISSSPTFQTNVNFNDTLGGNTVNVTPIAGTSNLQFAVASGAFNFNGLSISDLVTVTGLNAANSGTFLVTGVSDDGSTLQVLNQNGVTQSGAAVVAGTTFTATTQVSEGDTLVVSAPFNVLNQGQFRVIRRYNDSVWFENANVVEEEVSTPINSISLGYDATTTFTVNASNHTQYLAWNGSGTEPNLGNANMGDIVTFLTGFSSVNQGSFMVLRSGVKLQEIASFTMPSGGNFTATGAGAYFDLNSAGNLNLYRIWFNVIGGSNSAPATGGRTLVQVNINASDTASTVANDTSSVVSALNGALDFFTSTSSGVLTVTTQGFNATTAPVNGTMPSQFVITVLQIGQRSFLECVNPAAVNQGSTTVSDASLVDNRTQLLFSEYDATVAGDKINITNNAFNANNIGSFTVVRAISRDTVVVQANLVNVTNISLNGIVSSLFIGEGVPYYGYKQVLYSVPQPGTSNLTVMAFTTNAQYDKINQSALVQMVSLNKLNYSTIIKNGLDSYRYNTGLIQVANQIIYGDPRDNTTYPGVGAAGAEIFIRGPLIRRIQVALAIRLNTGVPFAQTVQQVQNTVTALVNSNKLGQPLAISSIIAAVSAIPGILAVSISFPNYTVSNDLIVLGTGEKALIIDPTTDVSVTQVGT